MITRHWKFIVADFYHVDNIITNSFIDDKNTRNKRNYQYHFFDNSISEYDISSIRKIIYNFICDWIHLADEINRLVIHILLVTILVIPFEFSGTFRGAWFVGNSICNFNGNILWFFSNSPELFEGLVRQ
jgi:hypothetical protein